MSDIEFAAYNIVNQLFDLAEVPVEKRQAINDQATAFTKKVLIKEINRSIEEECGDDPWDDLGAELRRMGTL